MTHVSRGYADQIAKDRGEAMDELERRNTTPVPAASERIDEIRQRLETRLNGGEKYAVVLQDARDLLALVDKQAAELARWEFNSRANMQYAAQNLTDRILKLQAFKDYVHQRLDEAGIPKEPNGEHSKAGCRVGDRLDIALLPQPDRAKADEDDRLATMLRRFGERSGDECGKEFITAGELIRTLSARAEAAEVRAGDLERQLRDLRNQVQAACL